jgi:hypothetical protein
MSHKRCHWALPSAWRATATAGLSPEAGAHTVPSIPQSAPPLRMLNQQALLPVTSICSLVQLAVLAPHPRSHHSSPTCRTIATRLGLRRFGSILRVPNTGLARPLQTDRGIKPSRTPVSRTLEWPAVFTLVITSGRRSSAQLVTLTAQTWIYGTLTTTTTRVSMISSHSVAGHTPELNNT